MWIRYSKLSNYRVKKVMICFCEDLTATQTAKLTGVNRNTINRYYRIFREKIAMYQEQQTQRHGFTGTVELDESYFGGENKGRRGRGTAKTPVFGIFKRNGKVYTQIIKNASSAEIRPIINRLVKPGSTVYTDKWHAYDGLVLNGYEHHRIDHERGNYSDRKGGHINGIESFWAFAKRRLQKFNGIRPQDFYLHLKECEFRFNERSDLFHKLFSIL
jgi:transposase-like protein